MKRMSFCFLVVLLLAVLLSCDGMVDKKLFENLPTYIAFTATEGTVDIKMTSNNYGLNPPSVSLQYSYDGLSWEDFKVGETVVSVQATDGNNTVYIQAKNPNTCFSATQGDGFGSNQFNMSNTGKVSLCGNIMALLDNTGKTKKLSQDNEYAFCALFSNCTNIENADTLVLPATELSESCYMNMFANCTGLKTAPALPAKTLADFCYNAMFYCCTSLETAPALPATTLAVDCYMDMFSLCTSLTSAPELPATTLAKNCYKTMFQACIGLKSGPALPVTTLAEGCYFEMFNGCKSLVSSPALPATTLSSACYYQMFNGCTSLTSIGVIGNGTDTVTLAQDAQSGEGCMQEMFSRCSSLKINNDGSTGTKFFTCPSSIPTNAVKDMFKETIGDNKAADPTEDTSYYWYTSDCM